MKMKKYINGNGFLTENGEEATQGFQSTIRHIISAFGPESESELRTIGAVLAKVLGDTISNTIQAKKDIESKLDAMSDEQFNAYMKAKYGDNWLFVTCTPEEGKRSVKNLKEKLDAAHAERKNYRIPYHGFNPRRK